MSAQPHTGLPLPEAQARLVAESLPHIVWLARADGWTFYFNDRGVEYTGLPREANYGWGWVELIHPEDAERARQAWANATATGASDFYIEYRIRRNDGVYRWHAGRSLPVRDAAGDIHCWLGTATDIDRQRVTEEALSKTLDATVQSIARTIEYRDPYTAGHQASVAGFAAEIATAVGLDGDGVDGIRTAAALHDIGKVSIPAEILNKPGRLSAPEMDLIRQHADTGYAIVQGVDFPWPVAQMIHQHHERLDGSGYPAGLTGGGILLGSRIIAVADTIEAMLSHRPYRPARSTDETFDFVMSNAHESGLFDPAVAAVGVELIRSGHVTLRTWR